MRSTGAVCSERAVQVGRDGAPGHDSRATMSKGRSGKSDYGNVWAERYSCVLSIAGPPWWTHLALPTGFSKTESTQGCKDLDDHLAQPLGLE